MKCEPEILRKWFWIIFLFFLSQGLFGQTVLYSHDFNSSDDGWTLTNSTNGAWERGTDVLNEGSDGTNFWYSTASNYSDDAVLEITSGNLPTTGEFDLVLSIDVRYDTEFEYDGMQIEYFDGSTWSVLGSVGDGFNWYNDSDVNAINDNEHGWTGDNLEWKTATIGLPAAVENNATVQFRIRFESDGSVTDVGVAFDNFVITSGGAEILVSGNGNEISHGDTSPSEADNTDFYAVDEASGSKTKNFTISNILGGTLNLTGGSSVSLSGTNSSDFGITQPADLVLTGGESTAFSITFNPSGTGIRTATVSISNTDSDENPYQFDIQGTGVSATYIHTFNSGDDGWTVSSDWIRGTDTYSEGADGSFWHLTNMSNYSANTSALITSPQLDFTGLSDIVLYVDIRFDTETDYDGFQIEFSDDDGTSWSRLGNVSDGLNWYNNSSVEAIAVGEDGWSGHNDYWQTAEIQLPSALNGNDDSRFRVIFVSDGAVHDLGVAFDNFMISAGIADIVVEGNGTEILDGSVTTSFLNFTDLRNVDVAEGIKSVTYMIKNRGGGTLTMPSTPVSIGGTHSGDFSVVSQPGDLTLGYLEETTFTIAFDPSTTSDRLATISISSDDGDESTFDFLIGGVGDNALYYYNFDASAQGWTVTENTNGDWLRGTAVLNAGATGSYWHTDPSNYSSSASLIIESPIIDLSTATDPFLSLDLRYDTEDDTDGVKVEYSDDNGSSWFDLGQVGKEINWYNDTDVDAFANAEDGWSGDNGFWTTSEIEFPAALAGNSNVRIRMLFASDGSGNDIGVAFDNVAIYGDVESLPVELIQFTGKWRSGIVELFWTTGSELDNDYFEIQRSSNGTDFYSIGKVNGSGTVNSHTEYSFLDRVPLVSRNYYRLRQVDFDGTFKLHHIISVDNLAVEEANWHAYPNPVAQGERFSAQYTGRNEGSVVVSIFDIGGREVSGKYEISSSQGIYNLTDLLPSEAGTYIIVITQDMERFTSKLLVR